MFGDCDLVGLVVFIDIGWDRYFGMFWYGLGVFFLIEKVVWLLVDVGVVLVGIDFLNIDDIESGGECLVYSIFFVGGVYVVEYLMRFDVVFVRGVWFMVVLLVVCGFGIFFVCVFVIVVEFY